MASLCQLHKNERLPYVRLDSVLRAETDPYPFPLTECSRAALESGLVRRFRPASPHLFTTRADCPRP